ncbi:unnamed protein product [Heligmosomoides polygyrus]|uniref:Uncharacterized protein n=1 Tax=Heligmosomoides polygyrus TaxID=6339 RepID=A0A183G2D9_HELPZ|nr:unnamed protein product [Heligmosomoides polygyrus]
MQLLLPTNLIRRELAAKPINHADSTRIGIAPASSRHQISAQIALERPPSLLRRHAATF